MNAMPAIGVGTYRLKDEIAYQSVLDAIELGYRHIDTAQVYGNEEVVGLAIKDSGISREELFVTTKVWNNKLSQAQVIPSVKESLTKLGLDYVDLLLVHWPSPESYESMSLYLPQFMRAKMLGLTKHIGVSNFTMANLKEAMSLLPASEILTNQIEVHPYLANTTLRNFCQKHDIQVTAYMPFAVGKVLKDETIVEIAKQHDASPAQIVLAWISAHGMTTIPSSTKRFHLENNLTGAATISLTEEEIQRIDNLDRNDRQANPDFAPRWD